MKLKFTQDYIGRETAMKQYHAGDVEEFSTAQGLALVGFGVALEVNEVAPKYAEPTYTYPPKKRKQKEYDE